jgi:hypothetical protein
MTAFFEPTQLMMTEWPARLFSSARQALLPPPLPPRRE